MALQRVLEPEEMDTPEEADAYDAMDHRAVNRAFVDDALAAWSSSRAAPPATVLDAGAGTALIAIEFARSLPEARVTAVDLAGAMLARAARNVARAGLSERVSLVRVDAKRLPYAQGDYALVASNSVVHHVPEPAEYLSELARVAGPTGALFVRDLCRPESAEALDALCALHVAGEPERARELFRASLHASLTVDEVRAVARRIGLDGAHVRPTSDRHWTLYRAPLA